MSKYDLCVLMVCGLLLHTSYFKNPHRKHLRALQNCATHRFSLLLCGSILLKKISYGHFLKMKNIRTILFPKSCYIVTQGGCWFKQRFYRSQKQQFSFKKCELSMCCNVLYHSIVQFQRVLAKFECSTTCWPFSSILYIKLFKWQA